MLLDVCCCQGGSSVGYAQAGFTVSGVDNKPQPRYPFTFYQADALEFLRSRKTWIQDNFAALAGSPPCQRYSKAQRIRGNDHPDLIAHVRDLFIDIGLPYVIENVEDAASELIDPVTLCGNSFGLKTYRHRLFETGGGFTLEPPEHLPHTAPLAKMGRQAHLHEFRHYVGNFTDVEYARVDMGMRWATREGIREAVPPAYTKYIGKQLLESAV